MMYLTLPTRIRCKAITQGLMFVFLNMPVLASVCITTAGHSAFYLAPAAMILGVMVSLLIPMINGETQAVEVEYYV